MLNCSYHTTLSHRGFKQPCSFFILSLGTGAVYSFDPVGSYERETCRAAGAAQSLVQPFLDNQVSSCFHSKTYELCSSFCLYPSDLLSIYRSTSKIRRQPLGQPSQNTFHYPLSCPSWSIPLPVQLNDTLRFVLFIFILFPYNLLLTVESLFFFSLIILGRRRSGNICCTSQGQQFSSKSSDLWRNSRGDNQCRPRESFCHQERIEEGLI